MLQKSNLRKFYYSKVENNWAPLVTMCDESHDYERMFVIGCSQTKAVLFFNELEHYAKLFVIKNALKCYTSVTFGVQFASETNIVTVRVHSRFGFDQFFPKKEFGGKCNILSTRAIRGFLEMDVSSIAYDT